MPSTPEFRPRAAVVRKLDRLGMEFLAEFLGRAVTRRPGNFDALFELGHVLTELGRHAEGLRVDLELVRLAPDNPIVHYNLGCSQALLGDKDDALASLRQAVELGYDDVEYLVSDEDLSSLRDDAGFQTLVRELEERAEGE